MPGRRFLLMTVITVAFAGGDEADSLGDIFVISMENHNFTQPSGQTSPQQIFGNPAAPFQNSLITPGDPNAAQASYASNYQNAGAGIHPSLPNYIWSEAGSNLGVRNDNPPFGPGGNNQTSTNLSGLLQSQGTSWKSYQEDINLATNAQGKFDQHRPSEKPVDGTAESHLGNFA